MDINMLKQAKDNIEKLTFRCERNTCL